MKNYFQIISFLIFFILCETIKCYPNNTVLVYNYGPLETCDPQDYWNQDKFGGLDFPILLNILNQTGWNRTEIAFMCIEILDDDIKAFSGGCAIDNFLFTFDEWLTIPIYIIANYSQPYHVINFIALASYKQPLWLFFKRFDPLIFFFVVLIPLILGLLMNFIVPKEQKCTQLSDYFGLIFFQPDITGRRNISHKIVSVFFMFMCLIINNYFTTMLQQELDDFKSFGDRSLDNGLNGVRVWAETMWTPRLMHTLAKPTDLGSYFFDLPTWRGFIKQHPGETFLIISSMGKILSHEDCNLRLIGNFLYVTDIIAIAPMPRQQYMELNAAIVDVTTNPIYPYIPDYELEDLMPTEDIKCTKFRKIGKEFQYKMEDFLVLWIIYAGAASMGLILWLYFKVNEIYHQYRNIIYSETILNDRATYLALRISSSVEVSLFWLIIYQKNFITPLCASKMKNIRKFFKEVDQQKRIIRINKKKKNNKNNKNIVWLTKIEESRKKVIKLYVDMYKKTYVKILLNTLLFTIKAQQKKKKFSKKNSLLDLTKGKKTKKFLKQTKGKKYLAKLIDSSLRDCLIKAMSLFNFSDAQPKFSVIKYVRKIGFQSRQRMKLKLLNKVHYKVNESFHMKMVDIFYNKIVHQIIMRAHKRNSYEKLIQHKDQITRLIESNRKMPLQQIFVMLMEVIVFLRNDRARKNKKNKLKRIPGQGVNALPKAKTFKTKHGLIMQQNLSENLIKRDDFVNVEAKNLPKEASPTDYYFQSLGNLDGWDIQPTHLFLYKQLQRQNSQIQSILTYIDWCIFLEQILLNYLLVPFIVQAFFCKFY